MDITQRSKHRFRPFLHQIDEKNVLNNVLLKKRRNIGVVCFFWVKNEEKTQFLPNLHICIHNELKNAKKKYALKFPIFILQPQVNFTGSTFS